MLGHGLVTRIHRVGMCGMLGVIEEGSEGSLGRRLVGGRKEGIRMADTTDVTLKTTGMHCRSCSTLVDMTLDDLDGVEESETDHVSGDTKVRFDPAKVSVDDVIAAIRSAGYDAESPE